MQARTLAVHTFVVMSIAIYPAGYQYSKSFLSLLPTNIAFIGLSTLELLHAQDFGCTQVESRGIRRTWLRISYTNSHEYCAVAWYRDSPLENMQYAASDSIIRHIQDELVHWISPYSDEAVQISETHYLVRGLTPLLKAMALRLVTVGCHV